MGEKGNAVAQGVTASKGFVDEVISVGESGGGFVAGVVTTAATAATAKHLEGRISERLDKQPEDEKPEDQTDGTPSAPA